MNTIEKNTEAVLQFYELVWSKGDFKVAKEICAPDLQFILAFAHLDGLDAFIKLVEKNRAIFENLTYSIPDPNTDIVVTETKAAAFWQMSAKHIGTWRNVPASDKNVGIFGMSFFRFNEEGKINEVRVQNDVMSLMNQIGGIKKLFDF
jgi:steroid delta-isomerase-like uncharacterized protein